MFRSTIRMTLSAERIGEAIGILNRVVERTRVEPGCDGCYLYRDAQEESVVTLEEIWSNKEQMDRHLRSPDYQQLLLVMEMASAAPEVRFDTVVSSTGIETIERARE
jgi:quinol monooxygenase YgiN